MREMASALAGIGGYRDRFAREEAVDVVGGEVHDEGIQAEGIPSLRRNEDACLIWMPSHVANDNKRRGTGAAPPITALSNHQPTYLDEERDGIAAER